jgi:hypothetical protein
MKPGEGQKFPIAFNSEFEARNGYWRFSESIHKCIEEGIKTVPFYKDHRVREMAINLSGWMADLTNMSIVFFGSGPARWTNQS